VDDSSGPLDDAAPDRRNEREPCEGGAALVEEHDDAARSAGFVRRLRLPGFRPFLCLRCPQGEIELTKGEARWLVARLLRDRRPAPDADAALVGLRIQRTLKSGRGTRLTLAPADASSLLRVLDDAEQREQLTASLRALQVAVAPPLPGDGR
jgi:hypothetical protein